MSGNNRELRGNTQQMRGTVRGNTVVEPGDFIVLNDQIGTCGNAWQTTNQVDYYLYPLASVIPATSGLVTEGHVMNSFVGVALNGSASGTTNEIVVALDGIYRYPLVAYPSAVTIGSKVSMVSPGYALSGSSASASSSQGVVNHATVTTNGTTAYLGHIVKTESAASFVDFRVWSAIYRGALT